MSSLALLTSHPATPRSVGAAVALLAQGCRTPFGSGQDTARALLRGETALRPQPLFPADPGADPAPPGGDRPDLVVLARCGDEPDPGRADAAPEECAPRWAGVLFGLLAQVPPRPWGTAAYPVFFTSSNFGIGELYAYHQDRRPARRAFLQPHQLSDWICRRQGWGEHVTHYSHACVSSNLGLLYASRRVAAGSAREALVVSYDFLSPFVTAGFHALKILGPELPAPYADRPFGAVGLGDGAAFAVLGRAADHPGADFVLAAQAGANEMYHFTGNHPEGRGMAELGERIRAAAGDRAVWIKGHGTGTIEAGRLEARHCAEQFPAAPLVSWKGALGHTLGSCGLVELVLAAEFVRLGRAPGTIGSAGWPCFRPQVATENFALGSYDGVVLNSYAFGGAHYALLLAHG